MWSKTSKLTSEAGRALAGLRTLLSPYARVIQPNKIVFCNHYGDGYGCNPKYIAEALIDRNGDAFDMVWLSSGSDSSVPASIRQVRFGSHDAAFELATAKVWVDNYRTRRYVHKKPGQFYVQTWHGSVGPKKIEADARAGLSAPYIFGSQRDGAEADLMFANNNLYEQVFRESFWHRGVVIRCGAPRNAVLLNPNPDLRNRVRSRLGVPGESRMVLWAPTFRDWGRGQVPLLPVDQVLAALSERFGGRFVCVVRAHPNDAFTNDALPNDALTNDALPGGILKRTDVFDASDYPDVQELLCAADALISDYSSVAEDFALTGRPGYLYVPDAEAYEKRRGFYYSLEQRPYPFALTSAQLICAIRATSDEEFAGKRKAFFDLVGMDEDGCGGQAVARVIEEAVGRI